MSAELAKAYDPSAIEEKWASFWARERLFDVAAPAMEERAGRGARANTFVQLLPPPNVTGRLHMGHMLNQTEMDILARWHRMFGERSVWVPGTDHAGIATQMMVERQLAAEGGPNREALGREQFVERVWSWKKQYGGAITEQMRRLGASVDWSREYFTMDARLSRAVRRAFVKLYDQGLIYRGAYIVNWDPVLQTAVSDLEVVHEERAGKLYHVRYPLADGSGSLTIATTRPETMLADVAVAVNPGDARYQALIGKSLRLPLSGLDGGSEREIPVIADDWANPEFGTGAVKITPAHDPNDFEVGQRHSLPQPNVMDATAHIALPGSPYHGLDRYVARERIVEDLRASGALVEVKDHPMAIATSQRTGAVIEPRLSMQWFLAVNKKPSGEDPSSAQTIAEKAIAAVREGHIRFTPEMYAKTYFEWMNNLHDWCLSRQLWWGHRIPAWYCGACGKMSVATDAPDACHGCGITDIRQETDVLDTWFSSGLLPFTVFGWGEEPELAHLTPDLAAFYPTGLLVTGFDILFFWVARMIMLGTHFMLDVPLPADGGSARSPRTLAEAVPFREVYIHGLVRDAERQKMSKTKGNVVDPISVIEQYGTDAVRFTLASQASPGTDIAFSEARTEGYRAFANKIWNAARFLALQIERGREAGYSVALNSPVALVVIPAGDLRHPAANAGESLSPLDPEPPLETRWIVSRLAAVCLAVDKALHDFRFDEAANAVYQFFWGEFCDWYLELVKLRLDFTAPHNEATALTLRSLIEVFEAALRLLSPFMPFLTEELWHALHDQLGAEIPAKSIALTRFPQAGDFTTDAGSVAAMTTLQELIVTVRALRKELGVPEKETAPVQVHAAAPIAELARTNADMLARLARVSAVEIVAEVPRGNNARSTAGFDVAVLYERQVDVAAERERLTKELARLTKALEAAERQLGNEGFIAKAPPHIVEGLKKQSAETRALKLKVEAALAAIHEEKS